MLRELNRITNRERIREELDKNMQSGTGFLAAVFAKPKNTIYEGVRVISAATDHDQNKRTYTFANIDTDYRSPVMSCEIGDIDWIEICVY